MPESPVLTLTEGYIIRVRKLIGTKGKSTNRGLGRWQLLSAVLPISEIFPQQSHIDDEFGGALVKRGLPRDRRFASFSSDYQRQPPATEFLAVWVGSAPEAAVGHVVPRRLFRESGSQQKRSDVQYHKPLKKAGDLAYGLLHINALMNSKPSWAGREVSPPNQMAARIASDVFRKLIGQGIVPDRIVASGEGGIAFCFVRQDAYADLECLNSGELIASTQERTSATSIVWEFSTSELADTMTRIGEFLATHGTATVRRP